MGGDTTLMVRVDLDHDTAVGDELKTKFWATAQQAGVTKAEFDQVVFVFAKDRLENWIEFLHTGTTDESKEGPRQKHDRSVADAAKKLANKCLSGAPTANASISRLVVHELACPGCSNEIAAFIAAIMSHTTERAFETYFQ